MGVASTIVCVILPKWLLALPPRIALVCSNAMAGLFSILFAYSSARERYWSYTFPGMVLITAGSSAGYILSKCVILHIESLSHTLFRSPIPVLTSLYPSFI